eukprot:353188-Chlamydomonas_euryale.AAC.2
MLVQLHLPFAPQPAQPVRTRSRGRSCATGGAQTEALSDYMNASGGGGCICPPRESMRYTRARYATPNRMLMPPVTTAMPWPFWSTAGCCAASPSAGFSLLADGFLGGASAGGGVDEGASAFARREGVHAQVMRKLCAREGDGAWAEKQSLRRRAKLFAPELPTTHTRLAPCSPSARIHPPPCPLLTPDSSCSQLGPLLA